MDRDREAGVVEQLAEAVRRLFGRVPTRELAVSFAAAPTRGNAVVPQVASRAVEGGMASPRLSSVPVAAATSVALDTVTAVSSSEAPALSPSKVTVFDAQLPRLASPLVVAVSPRPAAARSRALPVEVPRAVARCYATPVSRARCHGMVVPRARAASVRVVAPGTSTRSVEDSARAARLPVRRRRVSLPSVAMRVRAYRAFLDQTGLRPAEAELIGVFERVPAVQPERVAVISGGVILMLWYPVGVRSSGAAPLAVACSRTDGRLHAAFLSSEDLAEGGSQQRQ